MLLKFSDIFGPRYFRTNPVSKIFSLKFVGVNVFKMFTQTVLNYLFHQKWLSGNSTLPLYIDAGVSMHACMYGSL